jgi:DNA-binding response OmpR family regulator
MRILLVDDEKELVATLAERLAFRGIGADWVTKVEDVWPKVASEEYELAVLDIKMPGMDGITLKRELAKLHPRMQFLFLTGHGSEDSYQAAIAEAGRDCYLIKPVGIEVLVKKIRELLPQEEG